jgi:predicted RNA-binding Zn-ribbon protein involved in translation (DUF1610 family)
MKLTVYCESGEVIDLIHLLRCFYKVTSTGWHDGQLDVNYNGKEPHWDDLKDPKFYDRHPNNGADGRTVTLFNGKVWTCPHCGGQRISLEYPHVNVGWLLMEIKADEHGGVEDFTVSKSTADIELGEAEGDNAFICPECGESIEFGKSEDEEESK